MAEFPPWVYRLNPPFETSTTQIQTYDETVLLKKCQQLFTHITQNNKCYKIYLLWQSNEKAGLSKPFKSYLGIISLPVG